MTKTNLSRRSFVGAAAGAPLIAARTKKPNVLLIVCDQLSIDAISAHRRHFQEAEWGAHWVHTPNLDRLASQGVSFLQSHSENPVCCPARSAIFTGRWSAETGVIINNIGIDREVPNMGQWLGANSDYDRVYCGKWHIGGKWNYPAVSGNRKIPGFETMPVGNDNTGDISDYQVSSSADAYIRNHGGANPFLIVAGLMNPHDICFWPPIVPKEDIHDLGKRLPPLPPNHLIDHPVPIPRGRAGRMTEMQWRYYLYEYMRMVEKLDGDVGRMVRAVESRKDDTLIIFTGDHGDGLGRHGHVQKWFPYDSALKVPLILSCPGRTRRGIVDATHLVSGVDILPTICDYAGIPTPPSARGRSLRPLVEESAGTPWRDSLFAEMQMTTHLVRTARYKYVKFYKKSGDFEKPFLSTAGEPAVYSPTLLPGYQKHDYCLLFDIEADPWEMRNLAADSRYAGILSDHDRILRQEFESRIIPGRHFDRN
jgi:choline-sulfatase